MENDEVTLELDAIRALILDIGKGLGAISTLITSQIALIPQESEPNFLTSAGLKVDMDAVVKDKDGNLVVRNPDGSIVHRLHAVSP